jgi:dihydropyrimidinase
LPILIRNGTLVTAETSFTADLLIEGEKIARVGPGPIPEDCEVIDAAGKIVFPGGVDVHTHFDLPMFGTVSADDHYTGHKAAAFGGTTTVIDFVPQESGTLAENIDRWRAKADPKAAVDFSFHMNITRWNAAIAAEIPALVQEGVSSIKVFSAYNGRMRLQDGEIFQVLRIAGENGLLTMLHAENGDVIELLVGEALAAGHRTPEWHARTRPAWGAVEAVLRGSALAAQAGGALYIVHMNAAGEADQLTYAREHGVRVMGETCPQYLFFTEDDIRRPDGAKWICSPPVRSAVDQERLWRALAKDEIQVVATDHCPFFYDGRIPILYEGQPVAIPGKELGRDDFTKIPNGLPAVGDRLPVMWTNGVRAGRITANQFVSQNCTTPARIFGLYPQKGALLPGSDADLVIWDPEKKVQYGASVAQHRTDYNLYEGWELVGYPERVFLRGSLIVRDGDWLGRRGMGRFIHRPAGNPIL